MPEQDKPATAKADKPKLETYEVIGDLPIVDAETRESVRKGGTVKLDPSRTNIDALVSGGGIKKKG